MRPGIEKLACSSCVMRREPCVQGSYYSHHARIKYSTDRIWIRVASVEQSQDETSSRTCSNQANCHVAP